MKIPTSVKVGGGVAAATLLAYGAYRGYKYYKNRQALKQYQNQIDANTGAVIPLGPGKVPKALPAGGAPVATIEPYSVADQLAIDLGTAFPSYDPRSWTENDQEVYETLLQLNASTFPAVEVAYNKKYGRNLRMDVKKNLDRDLLAKIKYIT